MLTEKYSPFFAIGSVLDGFKEFLPDEKGEDRKILNNKGLFYSVFKNNNKKKSSCRETPLSICKIWVMMERKQ